jgi:hypothetical protein
MWKDDKSAFADTMSISLYKMGVVTDADGEAGARLKTDRLLAEWGGFASGQDSWTFEEAEAAFLYWISNRWIGSTPAVKEYEFSVTVAYKLPPLSPVDRIQFGISALMPAETQDQRDRAFGWLTEQCNRQYVQFMENGGSLPKNGSNRPNGADQFAVTCLRVESVKGERVYKCVGGDFTQFGLRIYDEPLLAVGIKPGRLPLGDTYPQEKWVAHLKRNKEGKAYVVARLEKLVDG